MTPRKVSILGATGSVGQATLDLIARAPVGAFKVTALTANTNVEDLVALARRFRPDFVAVADPKSAAALDDALGDAPIQSGAGPAAIVEAAEREADWTMAAIVGAVGLEPTLAALKTGRALAFANKEALVCAGEWFMREAADCQATLLPVDSEHNAIFQAFDPAQRSAIRRIILTASGGPFRETSLERMASATREDALRHPTWSMGAKISIDSATMMNKGLEIIEACHLFGLPASEVDVLVHPESIVHGLVEYCDGGLLAQLGEPDMRTPIAHALAWPDRMETPVERLDLARSGALSFHPVDPIRFPAIDLAREAFNLGGAAPAILNAANEVAVEAFLAGQNGFLDITGVVTDALERGVQAGFSASAPSSLDDVLEADRAGRSFARESLAARAA
ncbi:MAG: 1-deoxy-D-xylulose-5-phosphate reductoisomerase [Pseudomonadota bacterium]